MLTAQEIIRTYDLLPHPEGGYYKEVYRSEMILPQHALPTGFVGDRVAATAIYFLLQQNDFSAFHRIKSDESWHFYYGDALEIFVIDKAGVLSITTLGTDINKGQQFYFTVLANCWFASRPAKGSAFCFVGCTVAPGFDFTDFELAKANDLVKEYPQHEILISELCRE